MNYNLPENDNTNKNNLQTLKTALPSDTPDTGFPCSML